MPPLRAQKRRAPWVLVVTLTALVVSTFPAPPAFAADNWSPPVPGVVVRGYREPLAQFAPGHRGVDLAAPAGTIVRAASDGTITFAGDVSGALHVVIEHTGGIRTSYSFLAHVDVEAGDTVRRGAVVGTAGGRGSGHATGVLHFGARSGSRYFDPMLLFGPTDLTELVRLAPADRITATDVALLLREFDDGCGLLCDIGNAIGDSTDWVVDQVEDAIELGIEALRTIGELTEELIEEIEQLAREVLETLIEAAADVVEAVAQFAEMLVNGVAEFVEAIIEAGIRLYEQLTSCPQPPPKAHSKGSGNAAFLVAGLTSSITKRPPDKHGDVYDESFKPRLNPLGYTRDEVEHFSYREGSRTYRPQDTVTDLHEQAASMGRQLKEWAREHPGESIDLIGHSQGGVVIDLFLIEQYAGHEDEFPPIENIVTFGSPHEGTPIADFAEKVDNHLSLGIAARTLDPLDLIGSDAVTQMTSDSSTIDGIQSHDDITNGIRFLSIAGSEDPIVPSNRSDVPGATKVVVPVGVPLLPDDHSAVVRDDDAISAAQAHLEGRSPADSCGLLVDVGGELWSGLVDWAAKKTTTVPGDLGPVDEFVRDHVL